MIKKIIISGVGGQGVKYLGKKLAEKLIAKGFEVSLILTYDTAIEGGDIFAQLVYSDKKIKNVLIDKADILVELGKVKEEFNFEKKIGKEEIKKKFPDKRLNDGAFEFLVGKLGL